MTRGFIRERETEPATYRGYRLTIESDRIIVHAQQGGTRAEFATMPAARSFVRRLRQNQGWNA